MSTFPNPANIYFNMQRESKNWSQFEPNANHRNPCGGQLIGEDSRRSENWEISAEVFSPVESANASPGSMSGANTSRFDFNDPDSFIWVNSHSYSATSLSNSQRLVFMKKLEGKVESIGRKTFFVNFVEDDEAPRIPRYHVEFRISELTGPEQIELHQGSVVVWEIGLRELENKSKERYSKIKLRELPLITTEDFDWARVESEKILDGINWDE